MAETAIRPPASPGPTPLRAFASGAARYLGVYLLGIVTCLALTPASMELAGAQLWPWYPVFAPIAFFLFYFYLADPYLPSGAQGLAYWTWFTIGIVPLCGETAVRLQPALRRWRPLWLGFPFGFVGTLGVYYTAASSI